MANFIPDKLIGAGGFGEVWSGHRDFDGLAVAIKYLKNPDAESADRFRREVRCLETLSHPNIVRVLGKELAIAPLYYVMPLYAKSLFKELPSLVGNHSRIRTVFSSILEAIAYAHSEGIIHRDLKPENVLMNSDIDVVINDFGLGRIMDAASTRLTYTGQGFGTVHYSSPEQIADAKHCDARSDIYSLGQILTDLYCGTSFGPPDLTDVPFPIHQIITRATRRDPNARYQSIASMHSDLRLTLELLLGEAASDSLEALLEKLKNGVDYQTSLVEFIKVISTYANDGDVVHEVLMKLPPGTFTHIENASAQLTEQLSLTFKNFVTSQSWGFSYTDSIGYACRNLFNESRHPAVRSNFTIAALLVAVGHNRWEVMGVFGKMLEAIKDDRDAHQHWGVLRLHHDALENVRGHVNKNRLHPALRVLFSDAQPTFESGAEIV